MIEGSGAGAWRPKNKRIRLSIRMRNTTEKDFFFEFFLNKKAPVAAFLLRRELSWNCDILLMCLGNAWFGPAYAGQYDG
jgi:hypothetical protein